MIVFTHFKKQGASTTGKCVFLRARQKPGTQTNPAAIRRNSDQQELNIINHLTAQAEPGGPGADQRQTGPAPRQSQRGAKLLGRPGFAIGRIKGGVHDGHHRIEMAFISRNNGKPGVVHTSPNKQLNHQGKGLSAGATRVPARGRRRPRQAHRHGSEWPMHTEGQPPRPPPERLAAAAGKTLAAG